MISHFLHIPSPESLSDEAFGAKFQQADWLRRNGFERLLVPRYYVPLTAKGRIALQLKLQLGIKRFLPEFVQDLALKIRSRWYGIRYCEE